MTMTYGNGREETWKEGKKVQREQGKKRTLYTGEQGEKEVLPKGETSGPKLILSHFYTLNSPGSTDILLNIW